MSHGSIILRSRISSLLIINTDIGAFGCRLVCLVGVGVSWLVSFNLEPINEHFNHGQGGTLLA